MLKAPFILATAVVVFCTSACSSKKLTPEDFEVVQGTIKSFEERKSAGDSYLEFYLKERSERFRVPVDWYSKFDFKKFSSTMHDGSPVTIKVEKAELAKPVEPAVDRVPTVFVYEMTSEGTVFLSNPERTGAQ